MYMYMYNDDCTFYDIVEFVILFYCAFNIGITQRFLACGGDLLLEESSCSCSCRREREKGTQYMYTCTGRGNKEIKQTQQFRKSRGLCAISVHGVESIIIIIDSAGGGNASGRQVRVACSLHSSDA